MLVTEERSTSKASFLDGDPLPVLGEAQAPCRSGRRGKRGRSRAADGTPITAAVTGAYNIMRKVAPEACAHGRSGGVVPPMRLAA